MSKQVGPTEFFDNLCAGKLSRRQVNKILAAVGIGMLTVPVTSRVMAEELPLDDELSVFEWSGYDAPDLFRGYIAKHGKIPKFSIYADEEEAKTKLRAGLRADLSHPCVYSTARWRDAGLLKPVDISRLDHYGDIFPSLKTLDGMWKDDQLFFLPGEWGNSSVLFRTDLVDKEYLEEESWKILFDERYRGRLGIHDSVDGLFGVVGLVVGAHDPFDMTDAELEEATKLMRKQRDLLRFYWTDYRSVEQALASGELVASYAWNNSAKALTEQGLPVKYMNPKEGIYSWVCGLVLLANPPGVEDKAYDYLNAWTAPDTGAYVISSFGFGHSNAKSFDLVPQETLDQLGLSDPKTMMANSKYFEEIEPEVRQKYIELLEEIKAGG